AGFSLGHDGIAEADHIHAFLQQTVCHPHGQRRVAEHDRHDRVRAGPDLEAEFLQGLSEEPRVLLQARPQLSALPDQFQRLQARRADHRRDGVREQVRTRALAQQFDQLAPARREPASPASHRLAQRAGEQVHLVGHAEQLRRPPPGGADEAGRVAVVHHHESAVALGQLDDRSETGEVPVHRQDPIGGDQADAPPRGLPQPLFQVGHVPVRVPVPLGLAQADAVDHARVVQRVADHGVVLTEERLKEAGVRVETGTVEDGIAGAEERREGPFEIFVEVLRPADEPHRGHAEPSRADRLRRRLYDRRVVGQAQVIIGPEVDDRPLRDADATPLRTQQDSLGLIQACGPDLRELLLDQRSDLVVGHQGFRTTLPHWPFATRSNPSANLSRGRTWVTTGLMLRPALKSPERRYQVWKRRRPVTPYTRMPLKMISLVMSKLTRASGIPNRETRPPFLTYRKHLWIAVGFPDISSATSTPSPPVTRVMRSASTLAALIVWSAPNCLARSIR